MHHSKLKELPRPLVLYKGHENCLWKGPVELITWGRGCVLSPTGPLWLPAKRMKTRRPQQHRANSPQITWGSKKQLDEEAHQLLLAQGAPETPENKLLTYSVLITRNSQWCYSLLFCLMIFCPLAAGNIYWAHVLDPPTFQLQAWNNPSPPIFATENTTFHGWSFPHDELTQVQRSHELNQVLT